MSMIHRTPAMLCGLAALVLSAGAMANGQDRTNQPMQNSTPTAQAAQPGTPANRPVTPMNDPSGSTMSATAQSKFDALDVNHDGAISKQEAMASNALNKDFSKLDGDRDNKLSLSEFMSAQNLASIKVDKTQTDKSDKKDYR